MVHYIGTIFFLFVGKYNFSKFMLLTHGEDDVGPISSYQIFLRSIKGFRNYEILYTSTFWHKIFKSLTLTFRSWCWIKYQTIIYHYIKHNQNRAKDLETMRSSKTLTWNFNIKLLNPRPFTYRSFPDMGIMLNKNTKIRTNTFYHTY